MDLYPRDSNKPERGEDVGNALLRLIEENLEIERWGFQVTFKRFIEPQHIKVIYDSEWCRIKINFARRHYPETDEILVEYGRLHAPEGDLFMVWKGEGCRCWHNILDPLRFLDGLTPEEARQQVGVDKKLPLVVRTYNQSETGRKLLEEYSPKSVIVLQDTIWKHYGQRLFDLFDLRNPELWETYRVFLKKYYGLLGLKSEYGLPYEYVC